MGSLLSYSGGNSGSPLSRASRIAFSLMVFISFLLTSWISTPAASKSVLRAATNSYIASMSKLPSPGGGAGICAQVAPLLRRGNS
jgi:hypothetical protein